MSQYLSISLKKKDNKDIKINLWRVCTTPSRQIENEMNAFSYTDEDVLLDRETYFKYLGYIKEYLNEQKENKKKYMSELVMFDMKLSSAANKEVYEAIKEDIFDCKSMIKDFDCDIAEYTNYLNELHYVWTIYDENSKDWDLYYSNC